MDEALTISVKTSWDFPGEGGKLDFTERLQPDALNTSPNGKSTLRIRQSATVMWLAWGEESEINIMQYKQQNAVAKRTNIDFTGDSLRRRRWYHGNFSLFFVWRTSEIQHRMILPRRITVLRVYIICTSRHAVETIVNPLPFIFLSPIHCEASASFPPPNIFPLRTLQIARLCGTFLHGYQLYWT